MNIFDAMKNLGHEELIFCHDKTTHLKAIIAIHDTTLGPALGGCRMWPYPTEDDAVTDALRLSRGMTYKSAVAGSNYGGGKSVIWADPAKDKSEGLFRAFGRFVAGLSGRFITGTDVGTTAADMVHVHRETPNIVALPEDFGGSGDSSIITAFGVWQGVKAAACEAFGSASLTGKTIAIQGLGKVGYKLARHLVDEQATVIATDINEAAVRVAVEELGITAVSTEEIYDCDCDIFSPNALGGVLNDHTIPRLKCRAIAGGANNQLQDEDRHSRMLAERGILFAPDYVVNAGGLIQVSEELGGYNRDRAYHRAHSIYDTLQSIFEIARQESISTTRAANILVERRIAELGAIQNILVRRS